MTVRTVSLHVHSTPIPMRIRNINGTSQNTCSCGSWLVHWETFSGKSAPTYCPERTCVNKDLVGAHVQKADRSGSKKWYIIPLCNAHNQSSDDLEILPGYSLVSANKAETCDA